MDIRIKNPTLSDLISLAKFKKELASEERERGNSEDANSLQLQAEELHLIIHQLAKEALLNMSTAIELKQFNKAFNKSFLNPSNTVRNAQQLSLGFKEEVKDSITKEIDDVPKRIIDLDKQDTHIKILSKSFKDEEEDSYIKSLRNTLIDLLRNRKRQEAVNFVKNYIFREAEKPLSDRQAHDFLNVLKENYKIEEPSKNMKLRINTSIPGDKWVYAVYKDIKKNNKEDYLIREDKYSINMINSNNKVECHTDDILKFRLVTKKEEKYLEEKTNPFK